MFPIIREMVDCSNECPATGPHLGPFVRTMEELGVRAGASLLIDWLDSRAFQRRPWKLRLDPRGKYAPTERLLAECAALGELFEVVNDRVDFRPDVPPETRSEIEQYVRENYHPVVER